MLNDIFIVFSINEHSQIAEECSLNVKFLLVKGIGRKEVVNYVPYLVFGIEVQV